MDKINIDPRISVIVPTYNRSRILGFTLNSLSQQSIDRGDFEVIVVDDGSSDDTMAVVESFQERLQIRYIFQEDKGYRVARARNLGIKAARGRLCALVDSGIIVKREFLANHLQDHSKSKRSICRIGKVLGFDMNPDFSKWDSQKFDFGNPPALFEALSTGNGFNDIREAAMQEFPHPFPEWPAPWIFFWTCNVSIPRIALEAVGGFDELFQSWGVEDLELGYRLHERGLGFSISDSYDAVHYPHERNEENNIRTNQENKVYFHAKTANFHSECLLLSPTLSVNPNMKGFEESGLRTRSQVPSQLWQAMKAHQFNASGPRAVIGGFRMNAHLDHEIECYVEPNIAEYKALRSSAPGKKCLNLIGSRTAFKDREFACVSVSNICLDYPLEWLRLALTEWLRISRRVLIFGDPAFLDRIGGEPSWKITETGIPEGGIRLFGIEALEEQKA
jgi:glycosyltransferase involved in cell wall biosynthesis